MKKLENKVAVVTGASKGIGTGIAKLLAAAGARVVVNYSSARAGADQVVAEIKADGGKAIAIQGNVSSEKDITRLFAETKKAFGPVDILVNNAGTIARRPAAEHPDDLWDPVLEVNLSAQFVLTRELGRAIHA